MTKKQDETREETLKKGMSNPGEHDNLADVLLEINKRINDLEIVSTFSLILLIVLMVGLAINWGLLP